MNPNHCLSVQSDFSIGKSLLQVDHIVDKAKELGYESVVLCDEMSLHAMVDFTNKAKKAGIRPIIGCRVKVYNDAYYRKPAKATGIKETPNPFFTLKVYPTSDLGLKSLLRLLSKANTADCFYYNARSDMDQILAMQDVIISTGDFYNVFHHPDHMDVVRRLQERFGRNSVFVEMVPIDTPLFDTLNAKAANCSTALSAPIRSATPLPVLRALSR